jgi:replicative DNA helicase
MATEAPLKEKVLPHNAEAERTVLGAVLVDNQAFNSAAEVLTRDDFYREGHRRIFDAMAVLAERSQAIDLVTLKDELIRGSALEGVGGAAYLAGLLDGVPRITNVEHWSRIIKEKAVLRSLIHAGNRIVQSAYEAEEEPDTILDRAEKSIFDIAERRIRQGFIGIREIVKESFRTIDQLSQSKELVTGLPTGFVDLDERTSGLQKGDLIIVAARPAMGKTSFCLNIAQHATKKTGETVGIFSLEMAKEQLVLRMLCADARVDSHRLRTGNLQEKDWTRLAKAYADLSAAKIYIDDSATLTPLEMRAKCRRLKAEYGLGLVVVDYLQLMSGAGRIENRQQEIASISRSLKGLAKELNVPVLALSQLSRAPEARTEKRPQLSDLRECVTGETLVLLADGKRVAINKLVGRCPDVLAMSPEGKIVAAKGEKVWHVGRRRVWKVHLTNHRSIRATERHRLFTVDGWKRLEDLQVGEFLAVGAKPGRPLSPIRATAYGGRADFRFSPTPSMLKSYAHILRDPELCESVTADIGWDQIVSIDAAGEDDVFDLTVPGPASWLADGIVSHNSGSLEQDSDVVMFIYREEEYKPSDENRGIAEIIIGKQRNGPTGNLKLAFIKEFTRFENLEWRAGA